MAYLVTLGRQTGTRRSTASYHSINGALLGFLVGRVCTAYCYLKTSGAYHDQFIAAPLDTGIGGGSNVDIYDYTARLALWGLTVTFGLMLVGLPLGHCARASFMRKPLVTWCLIGVCLLSCALCGYYSREFPDSIEVAELYSPMPAAVR